MDYIIIGGGIIGSAIAFHLAEMNAKVLLLEKNTIGGGGATSRSRGIVRVYDEDPVLMDWNYKGYQEIKNWDTRYVGPSPFTISGCYYLMNKHKEEDIKKRIKSFDKDDYPLEILHQEEIRRQLPYLNNTQHKIALYEPLGGYGNPKLTAQRLAEGVRSSGNSCLENCPVTSYEEKSNEVLVHLHSSSFSADKVVFALGAYTRDYFETDNFVRTIPLTLVKNTARIKAPIIDEEIATYLRPEESLGVYCGSRAIQDCNYVSEIEPYGDKQVSDAVSRINTLLNFHSNPVNGFQGYDSYSSSFRPEFQQRSERVYSVSGMSGRGYKYALAYGKHIAQQLTNA